MRRYLLPLHQPPQFAAEIEAYQSARYAKALASPLQVGRLGVALRVAKKGGTVNARAVLNFSYSSLLFLLTHSANCFSDNVPDASDSTVSNAPTWEAVSLYSFMVKNRPIQRKAARLLPSTNAWFLAMPKP